MIKKLLTYITKSQSLLSYKRGVTLEVKSAYIHIPFCVRICTYCDFNKYFIDKQPVDEYIVALIKEMSFSKTKQLETMYVGGGTPTALSEMQLERLLQAINSKFSINGEFSLKQIQMNLL